MRDERPARIVANYAVPVPRALSLCNSSPSGTFFDPHPVDESWPEPLRDFSKPPPSESTHDGKTLIPHLQIMEGDLVAEDLTLRDGRRVQAHLDRRLLVLHLLLAASG